MEGSCFGATCPRSEQHRLHPRLLSRSWHGRGAALPSPPGELFFSQAMFLGADSQSPAGPEHASRSSKGRGAASCKCCWRHKMKNAERDGGGAMTSHALSIYSFSDPGELYPVASRFLASSSCQVLITEFHSTLFSKWKPRFRQLFPSKARKSKQAPNIRMQRRRVSILVSLIYRTFICK